MNITEAISGVLEFDFAGLTLSKVLSALLILAVCLVVIKVLLRILDRVLERTEIERSLHTFLRTSIKFILLFVAVLLAADSLGIKITSLIAILSVFGLALSLAVQNSLSNVAGGIQVLSSKPFKVDDYVEAGGVEGNIQEIGIFYTKILTWDNKLIQVPNSQIASEKIINHTAEPERRVDLKFTTSYNAPMDQVKETIKGVLSSHPLTLITPEPSVRVSKYGEFSIEYSVRVWCATKDYWTVYYDVLELVKVAFDKAGIEMTYPHLNVHMIQK